MNRKAVHRPTVNIKSVCSAVVIKPPKNRQHTRLIHLTFTDCL